MIGVAPLDALARKVLVIGLGNPDRGDDAVGGIVAEHLSRRLPSDVTIIAPRGDVLSLIGDWVAFDALVCIDAAAPMGMPGRIHRIALPKDELPSNFPVTSSHAFGLTAAIGLARALPWSPMRSSSTRSKA